MYRVHMVMNKKVIVYIKGISVHYKKKLSIYEESIFTRGSFPQLGDDSRERAPVGPDLEQEPSPTQSSWSSISWPFIDLKSIPDRSISKCFFLIKKKVERLKRATKDTAFCMAYFLILAIWLVFSICHCSLASFTASSLAAVTISSFLAHHTLASTKARWLYLSPNILFVSKTYSWTRLALYVTLFFLSKKA